MSLCFHTHAVRDLFGSGAVVEADTATVFQARDAALHAGVGALRAGTRLHRVFVDKSTQTLLGTTDAGAVRTAVLVDGALLRVFPELLVCECLALFERGHAYHTPGCTCATRHTPWRARQLGLATRVADTRSCGVHRQPEDAHYAWSVVARELGVADCLADNALGAKSIAALLEDSRVFVTDAYGVRLARPRCVRDADSLCAYLQRHPLGVALDDTRLQYHGLLRDTALLEAHGRLVRLDLDGRSMLYPVIADARRCDDDLVALWQRASCDGAVKK